MLESLYSGDLVKFEFICRCVLDIVISVHGYEQDEVQHKVLPFVCFRPLVMDTTPGDVEAPKDPGVQQTHYQSFSEQDFEGKYRF